MGTPSPRRWWDLTLSLEPQKKVLVLLLITVIIYGSFIAANTLLFSQALDVEWWEPADLDVYRERTSTILDGRILYRDLHTETPPLINYLLLPPQALGGDSWIYASYFSFFSFLTATMLYLGLRRWNETRAFITGGLFLLSPFAVVESTLGVQDETVITFMFLLPLILLLHERGRLSALSLGLGIWTKMFSVLLYPVLFLRTRAWSERMIHIALIVGVTAAIVGPFLLICPDDFSWFLQFYFLGVEGRETGGQSIWYFLEQGGIPVPGEVMTVITAIALFAAVWYCYRRQVATWQSALLITVVFFTFYPKIHLAYYMMPIAILLVWASTDRWIAMRCFILFAPIMTAVGFAPRESGPPVFDYGWGWIAGLLASLVGTILLLETTLRAMRHRSFLEEGEADAGG